MTIQSVDVSSMESSVTGLFRPNEIFESKESADRSDTAPTRKPRLWPWSNKSADESATREIPWEHREAVLWLGLRPCHRLLHRRRRAGCHSRASGSKKAIPVPPRLESARQNQQPINSKSRAQRVRPLRYGDVRS